MFHVPADYVQMERPVTASERTTSGPPPADFSKTAGARSEGRPGLKISGLAAIVLVFALGFGFLIHSGLLHLAASIVLDHPRFMQAMIATVILWVVGGFVSLFGLPWILGLSGTAAIITATVLVSIALLATGATVGLLSGASPMKRAFRQLAIGLGAAAVTYVLGLAFGTTIG